MCFICDKLGELICCDFCTRAYHGSCHRPILKKVPEGEFKCRECVCITNNLRNNTNSKRFWKLARYAVKQRILSGANHASLLFTLSAFLPPYSQLLRSGPATFAYVDPFSVSLLTLLQDSGLTKIDQICGWRIPSEGKPTDAKGSRVRASRTNGKSGLSKVIADNASKREYLVKWKDKSYRYASIYCHLFTLIRHNTWLNERAVSRLAPRLLSKYNQRFDIETDESDSELEDELNKADSDWILNQWLEVDRILSKR